MIDLNKLWFTSDTHFGHKNILKYCYNSRKVSFVDGRESPVNIFTENGADPKQYLEEHNEFLINRWNESIEPGDTVYHLGDFSYLKEEECIKLIERLNGNIHLIEGNHDKAMSSKVRAKFQWVKQMYELRVFDPEMDVYQYIIMCHFPFESWDKKYHGSWHCHGHSHGLLPSANNQARLDVGVDCNDLRPFSYEQIKEIMTTKVLPTTPSQP